MKTGLTISALVHAALLLWGLISFAARPLEAKPTDALPVDIISDKQFSEMTKGVKNAPKDKPPAPLVEKIGDPKPVEDSDGQGHREEGAQRRQGRAAAAARRAADAEARRGQARQERAAEDRSDRRDLEEGRGEEESRRKGQGESGAAAAKPQPKFDPTKIAALLDKREPQRQAATGETLSPAPSLGTSNGTRRAIVAERDRRAARASRANAGIRRPARRTPAELKVVLRVLFKPDATVATPPQLVAGHASPFGPAMAKAPCARS